MKEAQIDQGGLGSLGGKTPKKGGRGGHSYANKADSGKLGQKLRLMKEPTSETF